MSSLDPIIASPATGAYAQRGASAAKPSSASGGTSFAQLHAAATRRQDEPATSTVKASVDAKRRTAPKDERLEQVDGHRYSEIVGGPRNGMFLNQSGNSRDGEAFLVVKRAGREFHIYGEGRSRAIYEVGRDDDAKTSTPTTPTTPATPSTTAPATPAVGGGVAPLI